MQKDFFEYLSRQGVTQQQIREVLGISQSAVSHRKTGRTKMSWEEVEKLRKRFRLSQALITKLMRRP